MTSPDPKLYVRPALDEARLERQWSAIEQAGLPAAVGTGKRRGAWLAFGVGLVTASAAGLLLFLGRDPALQEGAVVESGRAEVSVRLHDGSRVQLEPASSLQLLSNRASSVELELRKGRARFDVAHDRKRPFRVLAGPAEVRVIGTRFSLAREPRPEGTRLEVRVSEGVVEVRRSDQAAVSVHDLHAGEQLEWVIPKSGARQASAPSQEPNQRSSQEPTADDLPALDEYAPPEPSETPKRAEARRVEPPPGAATELFQQASLARRAGRMREAAEAYSELLARHPNDSRAGLSAFELGRLRMDALADTQGAITALEQALRSGRGASFHEDALARIVVASDALGRTEACTRARARYFEQYPVGVHAVALAVRCK